MYFMYGTTNGCTLEARKLYPEAFPTRKTSSLGDNDNFVPRKLDCGRPHTTLTQEPEERALEHSRKILHETLLHPTICNLPSTKTAGLEARILLMKVGILGVQLMWSYVIPNRLKSDITSTTFLAEFT